MRLANEQAPACKVDVAPAKPGDLGKTHTRHANSQKHCPIALIELAMTWGMEWGGSWKYPDGMHFSVVKVIEPGGVKPVGKPPVEHFEIIITARGQFDSFKDAIAKRSGFKLREDKPKNELSATCTKESLERIVEAVQYYRGEYCVKKISERRR